MSVKLKIKKNATVEVISGQEKGKKGKVLAINKNKLKIKVEGVKVMTHYDKKDGFKKLEGFFDYSNVKLVGGAPETAKKTKTTKAKSKTA